VLAEEATSEPYLLALPVQSLRPAIDLKSPLPCRLGGAVAAATITRALQLLVIEALLLLPAAGLLLAGIAGGLPSRAGRGLRLLEGGQLRPRSLTGSPRIGALRMHRDGFGQCQELRRLTRGRRGTWLQQGCRS